MKQGDFQTLKQYVGLDLLTYVVNYQRAISDTDQLASLNLNQAQIMALDQLYAMINQVRIMFVHNGGYGNDIESMILFGGLKIAPFLNSLRTQCGGTFPSNIDCDDQLKSLLISELIHVYPRLLMKQIEPVFGQKTHLVEYEKSVSFQILVESDTIKSLTNGKMKLESSFEVNTNVGIQSRGKTVFLLQHLIQIAFDVCCLRMAYSLPEVIAEASGIVDQLRKFATTHSMSFSSFLSFRGLRFEGFDEIDFGSSIVRQLKTNSNPGPLTSKTFSFHNDGSGSVPIGVISEIKHTTTKMPMTDFRGSSLDGTVGQLQNEFADRFMMALVLHLKKERGISKSASYIGFPIAPVGQWWSNRNPSDVIVLKPEDVDPIKDWKRILESADAAHATIAIRRILLCVYERDNVEDGLVDAFVAWEAMFSGSGETTFKVCGSLAK